MAASATVRVDLAAPASPRSINQVATIAGATGGASE
jgi:hypothetical protein